MNGFIVINKLLGQRCTSLVNQASWLTKTKFGHGGTLDSTAQGLVLLLAGKGTRLTETAMDWPKTYRAQVRLGFETTTDDASGEALSLPSDTSHVTLRDVSLALQRQLGWVPQEPPQISALRVDGQRAHQRARQGQQVLFKPRFVQNISFRSLEMKGDEVSFEVTCHRGGYIRSIARQLGRQLGVGGHLTSLERLTLGPLSLEGALSGADITEKSLVQFLRPLDEFARLLPHIEVDADVGKRLLAGLPQWFHSLNRVQFGRYPSKTLALICPQVISLCEVCKIEGKWCVRAKANLGRDEA